MTNKTFRKYDNAFSVNYAHNDTFRKYVDAIPGATYVDCIYGCVLPTVSMLKTVIDTYRKSHAIFFNDLEDYDVYFDMCDFGCVVGETIPTGFLEWQYNKAQKYGNMFCVKKAR